MCRGGKCPCVSVLMCIYCKMFMLRYNIIFSLEVQHKHYTSAFVFRELRNSKYDNATLAETHELHCVMRNNQTHFIF